MMKSKKRKFYNVQYEILVALRSKLDEIYIRRDPYNPYSGSFMRRGATRNQEAIDRSTFDKVLQLNKGRRGKGKQQYYWSQGRNYNA